MLGHFRILCAPDSFKETLTAAEVAHAMAEGVKRAGQDFAADVCPIADGGEGSLDALIAAMAGQVRSAQATGPLGEQLRARFGIAHAQHVTGVVELAEASGLAVIPQHRRDPTKTTTFGTGELIRQAAQAGCETVMVCIGGSGTVDGGSGLAQALGAEYFDGHGNAIEAPMTGGMLGDVARITPPDRKDLPRIRIACDVTNPLCGPDGAAAVYGPQKGATSEQVALLDRNLAHFAQLCEADPATPGFGAAGGAAVGLVTLCGGVLERGIDLVLDAVKFDERCRSASLVLTGEGRLDGQSLSGKAAMGVSARAARLGVPTIAIVGSTGEGAERCTDPMRDGALKRVVSLAHRFGRKRAMREASELIAQVTEEIVRAARG